MPLISVSHLGRKLEDMYVLSCLRDLWEDMGLTVSVGDSFEEHADLCILHHNQTRLDKSQLPSAPAGTRVLNGEVLDISKRRYSSLMLAQDDPWGGAVIVKSNLNHFGEPEKRQKAKPLQWMQSAQRRLARVNWKWAHALPKKVYPVLHSIREVPDWVWQREELIVERFMPEREGDLYCLRGWLFFGTASYGYRLYATDPLVKTGSMVRHEYLEDVPPELEKYREEMKFDFGKFDYVMHDGKAILLDANKTPTFTGDRRSERLVRLAKAVEEFLP